MEQRRRIGVIMPAITESLDAAYLEGIYRQVTACGYDVTEMIQQFKNLLL